MEIKERNTDKILRVEKVYSKEPKLNKKTLLSVWENNDRMLTQLLLSPDQIKRLHEYLGHRLTELL